jgi:hypothetical protein
MLIQDNQKVFVNPPAGQYIGLLADVIDVGIVKTSYKPEGQAQIRIVWLLFGVDAAGQLVPYNDPEGRQFRVIRQANQSINPKSKLYETVRDVQNGELPSVPFESETLIGRANLMYIQLEKSQAGKEFANVKVILPLPATIKAPTIPPTFQRQKDRDKNLTSNRAAVPVQTVGVAAASASAPVSVATISQSAVLPLAPVPVGVQGSPVPVAQVLHPANQQAAPINLNAPSPLTSAAESL